MQVVDLCREIIAIDSTPSSGTVEMAEYIKNFCQKNDLIFEEQVESFNGQEQRNLVIRLPQLEEMSDLLLQSHLDSTEIGPMSFWTREGFYPFDATIKENKIYGLGIAGVKADIIAKLMALVKAKQSGKLKKNVSFLLSYGEESGMHGMLRMIRKGQVKGKYAFVGEPTDLKFSYGSKGFAAVEIFIPFSEQEKRYRLESHEKESVSTQSKMFYGKSAISSDPSMGESAIEKMIDYIKNLPSGVTILNVDGGVSLNSVPSDAALEFDLMSDLVNSMQEKLIKVFQLFSHLQDQFEVFSDAEFEHPKPTLTVGIIRTSDEGVMVSGSCRIPPTVSDDVYQKWMLDLQIGCQAVGAVAKIIDYKRPYKLNRDSNLLKICESISKELNFEFKISTQGNTNESSLLSRVGLEVISFGPGAREGNILTPFEHVEISSLEAAIDFYNALITRMCS